MQKKLSFVTVGTIAAIAVLVGGFMVFQALPIQKANPVLILSEGEENVTNNKVIHASDFIRQILNDKDSASPKFRKGDVVQLVGFYNYRTIYQGYEPPQGNVKIGPYLTLYFISAWFEGKEEINKLSDLPSGIPYLIIEGAYDGLYFTTVKLTNCSLVWYGEDYEDYIS